MSASKTGGCACGAIRYTATDKADYQLICHCRQCQQISGTGHGAQFSAAADSTLIEGDITFYDMEADSSGTVSSGFCGQCGSPILKKTTSYPGVYFIHAGSMDDPAEFEPQFVVFDQGKLAWDCKCQSKTAVICRCWLQV